MKIIETVIRKPVETVLEFDAVVSGLSLGEEWIDVTVSVPTKMLPVGILAMDFAKACSVRIGPPATREIQLVRFGIPESAE